jgi:hypothetical protein
MKPCECAAGKVNWMKDIALAKCMHATCFVFDRGRDFTGDSCSGLKRSNAITFLPGMSPGLAAKDSKDSATAMCSTEEQA